MNKLKVLLISILTFISFNVIADNDRLEIVSKENKLQHVTKSEIYIVKDKITKCEFILTIPKGYGSKLKFTLLKCPKD